MIGLALALLGLVPAAQAQSSDTETVLDRGAVLSPVLILDSDRLFFESAFGQRVVAEIEAEGATLANENRQIEVDLEAEERSLTEQRQTMAPEAFRTLADVFDEKVQQTRAIQATKGRALNEKLDKEREVFESAAGPVLELLMRESDAVVILERRAVFASASAIEITDDAIALLNETLGTGND